MVDVLFAGVIALLTTAMFSFVIFASYKLLKAPITRMISVQSNLIQARIAKNMSKMVEDIDVDEVLGKIGGGGGGNLDLGALSGLLGGKAGGLGDLLGLLSQFGGQSGTTSGSTPVSPSKKRRR